jgi:outer membrane protein assembly factor BamB
MTPRRLIPASALLVTSLWAFAYAGMAFAPGHWPQWRGPNRDGVSPETGLMPSWPAAGPPLAWRATGVGSGFSSVSVAAGRIYTMGDRGREQFVLAFNEADGKALWSARIGTAGYDDDYVGPRGTPSVDGDRVYALGSEGVLVALDAATGRERWRKSLPGDFGGRMMSRWRFAESPLVDGDRVVVTPGARGAAIVALDKMTGREIWRTALSRSLGPNGADGAGYSSIVISTGAGVKQYVQLIGRGLIGVRASDGTLLWNYNRIANDVANIPTPIVKGDFVFGSTGYGAGSALVRLSKSGDGVQAQEVYFFEGGRLQNHHGGVVLVGDHIYGGHGQSAGFPFCLEMSSGKLMWGPNIRNAGRGSAAIVYADGRLYFRYQSGKMILIEATPQGYREHGSFDIPNVNDPSWPHPVVAGGRLYLREQDTLYAYNVTR